MKALWTTIGGLVVLAGTVGFQARAQEAAGSRSIQDQVYSAEQAEAGQAVFEERCYICHVPEQFVGAAYMDGWATQSADDFIEFVRTSMPEDNPGSLKRSDYVAIFAYILSLNGIPAGETPLDEDSDVLKTLLIEGPFSSEPAAP